MTYLAGQIFVWIALTFVVGFAFAWWLRGRGQPASQLPIPEDDDSAIESIARERNEAQARCDRLTEAAGELESELEAARSRILALEMEREDAVQSVRDEGSIQTTTVAGAVDPFVDPPSIQLGAPSGTPSDLRQIRGLGKVLEMRLHELGFFHFEQLASLEGYDFNWLASKLGISPTRLEEMDWVGQAKTFVAEAAADDLATLPGVESEPPAS